MKRYHRTVAGDMTEAFDGYWVWYADAQAEIARLTAERDERTKERDAESDEVALKTACIKGMSEVEDKLAAERDAALARAEKAEAERDALLPPPDMYWMGPQLSSYAELWAEYRRRGEELDRSMGYHEREAKRADAAEATAERRGALLERALNFVAHFVNGSEEAWQLRNEICDELSPAPEPPSPASSPVGWGDHLGHSNPNVTEDGERIESPADPEGCTVSIGLVKEGSQYRRVWLKPEDVCGYVEGLRERITALEAALRDARPHVSHAKDCVGVGYNDPNCDCGALALRTRIDALLPKEGA